MIPDAIGRYQVFAQLGEGGFATVYHAYDPRLDRDVAVKVLHPTLARDPLMRDRFLQEAQALVGVRHPHLVRLFGAGEANGMVYLAMEFIPGRSLDAITIDQPLPVDSVCRIIGQIASALDTLHDAGLVHRDVKPANIMLTDDGRAVLVDLGVARSLNGGGVTSPSIVMGTPCFLAPEQLEENTLIGPRTDVYQLAATAYTLLAGRPPFQGSATEVLYAVAHRAVPDLQEFCPDLPAGMAAVIIEALAKNPQRRPARAGAFADALTNAALPQTLILPHRPVSQARTAIAPPLMSTRQEVDAGAAVIYQPAPAIIPAVTPTQPRRRSIVRWPLAVAAAGVALVLLGGSAVAVSYGQSNGDDAPRRTTQNIQQPTAWPSATDGSPQGRRGTAPTSISSGSRPTSYR